MGYVVGGYTEWLVDDDLPPSEIDRAPDGVFGQVRASNGWGYNGTNDPEVYDRIVALGKTSAQTLGISGVTTIWFRTFFSLTENRLHPEAWVIVGGKQLFWKNQRRAEDYVWGDTNGADWIGIGISEPNTWPVNEHIEWADSDFPEGGGNPSIDVPSIDVPSGIQLWSVAKSASLGWSLSQARLWIKRAKDYKQGGSLIGWDMKVKDMAEKFPWKNTNSWGRIRPHDRWWVGVWKTPEWGWGPSVTTLHGLHEVA